MNRIRTLLVAAALGGLLGCQAASSTVDRPAPASTGRARTPAGIPDSAFAGHRPFTGPPVDRYGQAALLAAYKEMVGFTFGAGWDPALIRKNDTQLSTSDFAGLRSYLTPARRKAFDTTFAGVVRADRAAIRSLEDVAFFGITGAGGLSPVRSGAAVTGRRFTDASVTGTGPLTMSFAAKAMIQLQDGRGRRYALPTGRTVRYVLVRNAGRAAAARPFLIDSWRVSVTVGRPRPAEATGP
jgi:hypothetical protein